MIDWDRLTGHAGRLVAANQARSGCRNPGWIPTKFIGVRSAITGQRQLDVDGVPDIYRFCVADGPLDGKDKGTGFLIGKY